MQWTNLHFHTSQQSLDEEEQHNHLADFHNHDIHQHHTDAFDSASHTHSLNTIELEHQPSFSSIKKQDNKNYPALIEWALTSLNTPISKSYAINAIPPANRYTTSNSQQPRAPPQPA